ncbi:hypothetical protein AEGHOMDF_2341 [Methylobacterium soli]|nr:hypothetical protein AEGHOMDF_2341 [Methylobacterium soli]
MLQTDLLIIGCGLLTVTLVIAGSLYTRGRFGHLKPRP